MENALNEAVVLVASKKDSCRHNEEDKRRPYADQKLFEFDITRDLQVPTDDYPQEHVDDVAQEECRGSKSAIEKSYGRSKIDACGDD